MHQPRGYQTIIFDFDGTLADTLPLAIELFNEASRRPDILTPEFIEKLRGMPAQAAIKAVGIPLWRIPRLVAQSKAILFRELARAQPFADIPAVIKALAGTRQLYVMSSNSANNVNLFLERHDLREYFAGIYGDVGLFSKAKMLKKIIKEQQLNKKSCIYVGDETRDIEAAHKIGLPIISVGWGYNNTTILSKYRPEYLLEQPKQLESLV